MAYNVRSLQVSLPKEMSLEIFVVTCAKVTYIFLHSHSIFGNLSIQQSRQGLLSLPAHPVSWRHTFTVPVDRMCGMLTFIQTRREILFITKNIPTKLVGKSTGYIAHSTTNLNSFFLKFKSLQLNKISVIKWRCHFAIQLPQWVKTKLIGSAVYPAFLGLLNSMSVCHNT